jgi:hypothetical protein
VAERFFFSAPFHELFGVPQGFRGTRSPESMRPISRPCPARGTCGSWVRTACSVVMRPAQKPSRGCWLQIHLMASSWIQSGAIALG